jgi:diaminopimelate decarboxylase
VKPERRADEFAPRPPANPSSTREREGGARPASTERRADEFAPRPPANPSSTREREGKARPASTATATRCGQAPLSAAARERACALTADQLPAFVYDLDDLRAHARAVRAALPGGVEFYYAAKANPDPPLLRALRSVVDGFEVASGGELTHVSRTVPDSPLAFGGPGKTADELAAALDAGVSRLHVESVHELRMLAALAAGRGQPVDVLLRANPPVVVGDVALAMGGQPSPFGLDPAGLAEALAVLADQSHLRLRGLHAHLASGMAAGAHLSAVRALLDWARDWAAEHQIPLAELNIGGGMGVDYLTPDQRFDWASFGAGLGRLRAAPSSPLLRIEPGRSVSAYCGWYVTEVLDVKVSHGQSFAVLRGGTHHLRTPATKGHDQPFAVLPAARSGGHASAAFPRPSAHGPVTLVGQLCTPKDVLARQVPVTAISVGDRIAFALAGAYAWNISHHEFLMHPPPTFHYLSEG